MRFPRARGPLLEATRCTWGRCTIRACILVIRRDEDGPYWQGACAGHLSGLLDLLERESAGGSVNADVTMRCAPASTPADPAPPPAASRRLAAVIGLLLVLAAPAHAGRWKHGPQADTLGVSIKSWSTVNPDQYRSDEGLLPAGGAFQAYHVVDGRPDLVWICFGVFQGDSTVRWPAQRWPVLYADSLRIVPGQAFAVGAPPTMTPLPLALLEPDRMWRLRFQGNGDVATVVFAGYPRGAWRLDHVDRLRLERRTEGGSP